MGKLGVVVVAAGKGSRMRTRESKQYLSLLGKPILVHTLDAFEQMEEIDEIILVVGADDVSRCRDYVVRFGLNKVKSVVAGGSERQDSVYKGLMALSTEWVMVHDGVRPFVRREDVAACWEKAQEVGAAVLAVPVKDTIKMINEHGIIESTPDRRRLWAIQTPQAFRLTILMRAHEKAEAEQFIGTDDASLVERMGLPVHVVEGDYRNIKITTPEDLDTAHFLLLQKAKGEGDL